jgi:hypothetical protein
MGIDIAVVELEALQGGLQAAALPFSPTSKDAPAEGRAAA